jgi:hypothetical protein
MSETNGQPGQIFTLIPKVMKAIGAIGKGRRNQQQGYAFRGIDEVMNALHAPLCEHGVFYATEVIEREQVERQTKSGGALFYTTVKARFTFYAPDASSIAVTTVGEAMDSADKSSNKAMSAALKYALLQLFCIPTEDQEDADATTPPEVASQGQKAVRKRGAKASEEQVGEIKALLSVVRLPEGTVDKWFAKAGVERWEDFPAPEMVKVIEYVKNRLPEIAAA